MNKKVLCSIFATLSLLSLSGCDGGTNGGNSNKVNARGELLGGINDVDGVWGAVPNEDIYGLTGNTSFRVTNSTGKYVTYLGCLSQDDGDMKLSSDDAEGKMFGPRTTFDLVSNTDPKLLNAEVIPGYLKANVADDQKHMFTIHGDGGVHEVTAAGGHIDCFFKISDGTDQPSYFKISGQSDTYNTTSLNPFFELDRPYNDQKQYSEDLKRYIHAGGNITKNTLAVALAGYYAQGVVRTMSNEAAYKQMMKAFMQRLHNPGYEGFEGVTKEQFIDLNKAIASKVDGFNASVKGGKPLDEAFADLKSDLSNIVDKYDLPFKNSSEFKEHLLGQIDEMKFEVLGGSSGVQSARSLEMSFDGLRPEGEFIFTLAGDVKYKDIEKPTPFARGYHNQDFTPDYKSMVDDEVVSNMIKDEDLGVLKDFMEANKANLANPELWEVKAAEVKSQAKDGDDIYKYYEEMAEAIKDGKIAERGKYSDLVVQSIKGLIEVGEVTNALDKLKELGRAGEFAKAFMEYMRTVKVFKNISMATGMTVVGEAFDILGFQEFLDIFTLKPAQGSYNTGISSYKVMGVTLDDLSKWRNSQYKDTPLDTSSIVKDSPIIGVTNNTYAASYTVTPNNEHTQYQITLQADTTPFIRPSGDDWDPSVEGHEVGIGKPHRGDAVLSLSIEDNSKPTSDTTLAQMDVIKESPYANLLSSVITQAPIIGSPVMTMLNSRTSVSSQLNAHNLSVIKIADSSDSDDALGAVDTYVVPVGGKLVLPISTLAARAGDSSDSILTSDFISASGSPVRNVHSLAANQLSLLGAGDMMYTNFKCPIPYKLGSTCNLEIASMPSLLSSSSVKSAGMLYVGTVNGASTAVPVKIGYNLVLDQNTITVIKGSTKPVNVNVLIANLSGYSKITFANLPDGAAVVNQGGGIIDADYNTTGTLQLDAAKLKVGTYKLTVVGYPKDGSASTPNDIETITLNVRGY